MQRRWFLVGAASAGLLSGCLGAGEGIDARRVAVNGSTNRSTSPTTDVTDASRNRGLELLGYEFYQQGSSGGIRGVVENRSEVDLDFIAAYARYFDESGSPIGRGFDSQTGLNVGDRWQFNVRLLETDASNVTRYQLAVIDQRSSEVDPFDADLFK